MDFLINMLEEQYGTEIANKIIEGYTKQRAVTFRVNTLKTEVSLIENKLKDTGIDYKNITSEAISLNAAYISGMLDDIIGEPVVPTISGRMGTGEFKYQILLNDQNSFDINVENSQMEIDGSYESISKFIILEAKNHYMKDFIMKVFIIRLVIQI